MHFCPTCANILHVQQGPDGHRFFCRSCPYVHAIKKAIARGAGEYVKCSIGLAANSYLAKVATDLEKPDGLVVLHLDELPGRILHFKLRDLPWIGRNMERRLIAAGVPDIPALWGLSAMRMRRIWGSVMGQRFWYMLHGVQVPPLEITKRMVGHSHVLAPGLRPSAMAHTWWRGASWSRRRRGCGAWATGRARWRVGRASSPAGVGAKRCACR